MAMTYLELKQNVSRTLAASGIESFNAESQWLIAEYSGLNPLELTLSGTSEVPDKIFQKISAAVNRRCGGEPLQYILGKAYFREIILMVNPSVLIPRPETELLVDWVLHESPPGGSLLELGTGSGAIALSCAAERPDLHITASDISLEALKVAKENAGRLNLRVDFIQSDLYQNLAPGRTYDLIAANLPYVRFDEKDTLASEVRDFEPHLALFADQDGLEIIFRAASGLSTHLKPGGKAIFELSPPQAPVLKTFLEKLGFSSEIKLDHTRRERFVTARMI